MSTRCDRLNPAAVLAVLDRTDTFPMMDNGYVYPAASRLTVYSDARDWSVVIEVFGFMPRAGIPDVTIATMGSTIANASTAADFVNEKAYAQYVRMHSDNELDSAFPLDEGDWIDGEQAVPGRDAVLRGRRVTVPDARAYPDAGVTLEDPPRVAVFEFVRWLAEVRREDVLATDAERRKHVPEGLPEVLRLDEWRHPDLVEEELPSEVEDFRRIALVAATGDSRHYTPAEPPNTHWSNWPNGGTL